MRLRESIVRTVVISVIYAILEAYYVDLTYGGNLVSPYHILVFLLGVVAGFDRNLKVWVANSLTYSVLEDAFYWVFKSRLPFQWGSEYMVVDHVPVYYVPYSITAVALYMKSMKDEGKNTQRKPGRAVALFK
jgi:hypothetical protein